MGVVSDFLDNALGRFGLSWTGSYSDYYDSKNEEENFNQESQERTINLQKNDVKIAILLNSRCVKEALPKNVWLRMSKIIEEKMTYFTFLPYQICDCSYIGENKAWTTYNMNNKHTLSLAISEINQHLANLHELEENDLIERVLPSDYHIDFNSICFDFGMISCVNDLPRSYLIYAPETKTGKHSQYPLIAFFNTILHSPEDNGGENYLGELYYSINGELSKAKIQCHKDGKFAEFNFSVLGRTFMISSIKTLGRNGMFTLYDCMWKFTDYIDFAD